MEDIILIDSRSPTNSWEEKYKENIIQRHHGKTANKSKKGKRIF